jgi:hypothetical protein
MRTHELRTSRVIEGGYIWRLTPLDGLSDDAATGWARTRIGARIKAWSACRRITAGR